MELRGRWERDRALGLEGVFLPEALSAKYPSAGKEWDWFWLFPSKEESLDPWSGKQRRHHVHEGSIQQLVKRSAKRPWSAVAVTGRACRGR